MSVSLITFPSITLADGTVVEAAAHHTEQGWVLHAVDYDREIAGRANVLSVIPDDLRGLDTSYAGRFAAGMALLVNAFGYVRGITGDDCDSSDPILAR